MAKRFTDLLALTSADSNDILAILDVSANTTKQVTVSGLLTDNVDTVHVKDNAITANKLAALSVTAAKMGMTVAASTNSGTAGGTINVLNFGPIKIAYGQTTVGATGATQVNNTVVIPASTFTTVKSVMISGNEATVDANMHYWVDGSRPATPSAGFTLTLNRFNNSNGSATLLFSWLIIGT